jgi:tRNA(His) guanylyltransferase
MPSEALATRMKFYESSFASQFHKFIPVIARLDGRAFHSFTRGLKRPYDERLSELLIETTRYLVQETNARCGYTQSDEITLVWLADDWDSEIFFAGRLQKMNSILASMTSTYFNVRLSEYLPEKAQAIFDWLKKPEGSAPIPQFDCRVFQVPTDFEAVNCFIWREQDASRNSVQMAAQSQFSHNQCQNKDNSELQEMLWRERGINWNDYPAFFKRGTYVRKRNLERAFNIDEIEALPPKHAARNNPNLVVKRTAVARENFPPLSKIGNREEVILYGEEPQEKAVQDVE